MNCPERGALREWLDLQDERGDTSAPQPYQPETALMAEHLARCGPCRDALSDLEQQRILVGSALAHLGPERLPSGGEVERALRQLQRKARARSGAVSPARPIYALDKEETVTTAHPLYRWRVALGGIAATVVLSLFVGFTPLGQAATAQFLAQFRSERFTVIAVSAEQSAAGLRQLERLGTVSGDPRMHSLSEVKSLAEASQRVGFQVKEPDPASLPAAVDRTPASIRVGSASEFRFTFDRDKARQYFQEIGRSEVQLPDEFHGASLIMSVPARVLLTYRGQEVGTVLMVGQTRELEVGVEGGVSLDELREFLLTLPGLSAETVRQLRNIQDWRNTLPIPVPADEVQWQQTTLGGGQGLLLNDSSGLGSGAIWQRDGLVYGVAGTFKADEIRRVADSLR